MEDIKKDEEIVNQDPSSVLKNDIVEQKVIEEKSGEVKVVEDKVIADIPKPQENAPPVL